VHDVEEVEVGSGAVTGGSFTVVMTAITVLQVDGIPRVTHSCPNKYATYSRCSAPLEARRRLRGGTLGTTSSVGHRRLLFTAR